MIVPTTTEPPAVADTLVLGSGPGGSAFAATMGEAGAEVVVVEAGPSDLPPPGLRPPRWHDGAGRPLPGTHLACLGGHSRVYGGVLTRFDRTELAGHETPDGAVPAWPLTASDLADGYAWAEAAYGVRNGPGQPEGLALEEPWDDIGRQLSAMGLGPHLAPIAAGADGSAARPVDAASVHLGPAAAGGRCRVVTGWRAIRLLFDRRGRARAVELDRDGDRRRVRAGRVVLACGAIESAHLVLRSIVGTALEGRAEFARVGQGLRLHQLAVVELDLSAPSTARHEQGVQVVVREGETVLGSIQSMPRSVRSSARVARLLLVAEDAPEPSRRITGDGGRLVVHDPVGGRRAIARLERTVLPHLRSLERASVGGPPTPFRTTSHQCGTLAMSADPGSGPCRPDGSLHGSSNTFVVDGAALPGSGSVGPTLTIVANARRVALGLLAT